MQHKDPVYDVCRDTSRRQDSLPGCQVLLSLFVPSPVSLTSTSTSAIQILHPITAPSSDSFVALRFCPAAVCPVSQFRFFQELN